jgi:hypothetical protein
MMEVVTIASKEKQQKNDITMAPYVWKDSPAREVILYLR